MKRIKHDELLNIIKNEDDEDFEIYSSTLLHETLNENIKLKAEISKYKKTIKDMETELSVLKAKKDIWDEERDILINQCRNASILLNCESNISSLYSIIMEEFHDDRFYAKNDKR